MQARRDPLTTHIERAILQEAGLFVIVEEDGRALHLTGRVNSPQARRSAEDVARATAPDAFIVNDLEIEDVLPFDTESEDQPLTEAGFAAEEVELDLAGGTVLTDPMAAAGPSSDADDVVSEGNLVYFPPTDPVIQIDSDGQAEVLGGFSPSSDDSIDVDRYVLDDRPGDEALADAVLRELREDAATTHLEIEVVVRDRVAHLYGHVPDLDDAQNAEEVASRVPGLLDVDEELVVLNL